MNRKFLVMFFALLLIGSCGDEGSPDAESLAELKLYVFDCGRLRLENVEAFSVGDDETDVRDLAVPCYVIEHEKSLLLWDGGLPSATADSDGWQGDGTLMRLEHTFAEQLADIKLNMSSFDFMAFSHMHFDHVGVANEVQGAKLIIQKAEYDAAFADPVTLPGADPSLYSNLRDAETLFITGDHDVFGDGRVKIISAPGHTPGHQVLFIDLANTGPIVLSGDLYHFALSRIERRVPSFNVDADATLASMDRVEAMIAEEGATLWIEHELALFEKLKQSPEYYD